MNARRRDAQSDRQCIHAQSKGHQVVFAKNFTRVNGTHTIYGSRQIFPLVIIDNFNFYWTDVGPYEADSPLTIDANTVLTSSIALECFEPIARRSLQKIQGLRCI